MTPKKPSKKKAPKQSVRPVPKPDEPHLPTGVGGDRIPLSMLLRYNTFVELYMENLDCAASAKEAGWVGKNPAAQKAMGGALLRVPYIATRIENQYRAIMAKTNATVERIWEEISHVAFLDPAVLYDEDGTPKAMADIPESARRALTGMKVKEGTIGEDGSFVERELKFAAKDAAIDKLMRLHRMTDNDKFVIVGGDEFLQRMQEGRERAAVGNRGK